MFKKLLLSFFLISLGVHSQTYVKGILSPAQDYSWIALYQLKGSEQLYIANTTISNGEFLIELPENASKGMYRLFYDQQNNGILDFIYNHENVALKFNPLNPSKTVEFLASEENKIYSKYLIESANRQRKLDSLQFTFFNLKEENEKNNTRNLYQRTRNNFNQFQMQFETNSEGKLANHFITSSNKYYAENLIETPQKYLNSKKLHYFDFINFEDQELRNSIFMSEKIIAYVFYLNRSNDIDVQNGLYKNAVNEVLFKMEENTALKSEVLTTLLFTFAQIENTILIDFLLNNFYLKLPENFIDKTVIKEIQATVKLAIGKIAPEITWQEDGTIKILSKLDIAENYIVVFWSTGCSHCLLEIPQLYEFVKDNPAIHVVAIALENDELGFNEHTPKYVKFTNVLGLNKWQNTIANEYEITSTPTYFVLDKHKKIIAKPEFFKDVKAFFEN
jgi:thiol-disulfide isomerase/thioredoxin